MYLTQDDLRIKKDVDEKDFGRFILEPLPKGYADTLGSSLRRVLLSSIKGAAPTQVEIEGVFHQFTSIKGVKEDVVEITLNLKKLRVRLHTDNPVVLTISEKGPKKVTAKDIDCPSDAEIANKDLHIATLSDDKVKFKATIIIEPGYGYIASDERKISKIGVIALDSIFSPVLSVSYRVEPTRVGQETGLDRLVLEVTTDSTVKPFAAFLEAAKLLENFYGRLSSGKESVKEPEIDKKVSSGTNAPNYEPSDVSVEELHLPTRTINALKKSGIKTLADLTKLPREEMSQIRNLGDKSIEEITKLLEKEGLAK